MRAIIFVLAVALALLPSAVTFGQLPSCPGPALPEKPGAELSPETRFFSELARLDGVLADGQILQGCLVSERLQFEIETGRGPQRWEAPVGEVVGYLPAFGEEPRVLLFVNGEFELRAGQLVSPLAMRVLVQEPFELSIEPEQVESFVVRGVYHRLPLTVQARLLSRAIFSFQQVRTRAELIATQAGGVFSGEVLTQEFSVQLRSGEVRKFLKSELRQLTVLRSEGLHVQIYLSNGQSLEGVTRTEALRLRVWGREVGLAAAAG